MVFATLGFLCTLNMQRSYAADLSQFKAGNIMSDAVMRNYTSMTESEIQSFLRSKNACNKAATAGKSVTEGTMYGVKYNHSYTYNGTTYYYHVENGKYVCLANEKFNGETAAHIIYDVSRQYKINPQVLIVLLEKEQGLITDLWPNINFQYRSATGFGCPDNAPCDKEYYGLRNQIESAAWLFNKVLSGGWTNYPLGWNEIRYSPNASCGSSKVYIENLATSALYRYTPYQPNQAALAAYTGSATCGAYGNRNFYIYFTDWFGSTQKVKYSFPQNYYNRNKGATGLLTGDTKCVNKDNTVVELTSDGDYYCSQDFEKGTLFWETNIKNGVKTEQNSVFFNKQKAEAYKKLTIIQRKDNIYKAWLNNSDTLGNFKAAPATFEKDKNYRVLQTEKGVVFGNDKIGYTAYKQKAFDVYKEYFTTLGLPSAAHAQNGAMEWYGFNKGLILGNDGNGWFLSMGASRDVWAKQGYENGSLGYPKSQIITDKTMGIVYQEYAGAVLVSYDNGAKFSAMNKTAFNAWKKNAANLGKMTKNSYGSNPATGIEWYGFEKGLLVGSNKKGWYESRGKIRDVWASTGFEGGSLGFPKSDITEKDGIYSQTYEGGVISGNEQKGYSVENDALGRAYERNKALLGTQATSMYGNPATGMKWVGYEKGLMVGNDSKGWYISIGKSRDAWARLGYESGLGFPTSDIYENPATGMKWQGYEKGLIVGNDSKGWYESRGRIREKWQNSGFESGRYGFPKSDISGRCQRYEGGTICE